ncbi:DUF167 domain-containing protein [archaeon]|jgi:uncharacterized protein (TIGR00251 family)|nr:DUF167 domain-containing protein [archaeon]MBT4373995.1 DUF167 domain-containing protein [archaeon]MBT4532091.1 DUF167 domain-containing protein [archaeon]MBT7001981.1 DUF167 domain-containing protein [archaeon]MBT7282692.1 DUF167 domain-containing protein [archaeon]
MRFKIRLHPGSSQEKVEKISEEKFEVWIKEKPIEGKANLGLVKIFKRYFKKEVKLIGGLKSKNKIVEMNDEI